jgi:ureidoacrylate peracid hydrolase
MTADERAFLVDARPEPVRLKTNQTAVLVVDMQNDFASPGGMFDLAGIDISSVQAIVEPIATVLGAARAVGIPVFYLKMGFRPDLRDAGHPTSPTWLKHIPLRAGDEVTAPDGSRSRILVRGEWGTEIVEELTPRRGDGVLYKHRYSGFFGTDLDARLRAEHVDTLVVVGATTSVCVESTVRDAMFRDYHCLVLEDCTAEPIAENTSRSNHEASLTVLELLFGSVAKSSALIDSLERM